MYESKIQLGPDTWVYIDESRSKLIVEIDLPRRNDFPGKTSEDPVRIPEVLRMRNNVY